MKVIVRKGGVGSGFHGHAGRPGEVGGSSSSGGSAKTYTEEEEFVGGGWSRLNGFLQGCAVAEETSDSRVMTLRKAAKSVFLGEDDGNDALYDRANIDKEEFETAMQREYEYTQNKLKEEYPDGHVELYRALHNVYDQDEYPLSGKASLQREKVLASWSGTKEGADQAIEFWGRKMGYRMLKAVVPIEDIFAYHGSAFALRRQTGEGEFIVINRGNYIDVDVVDSEAYVRKQATIRLKGGEGSGFHGHAGRPGEVGGSSSSDSNKESLNKYLGMVSSLSVRSAEHVVLKHGKYYNPQKLPKGYKMGKQKECFSNAYHMSQKTGMTYVEGFAVPDFIDLPIHHAWVVDKNGNVFDNTWKTPGVVYFGIPFDDMFVSSVLSETGTFGVITFQSSVFRDKYMESDESKEYIVIKGGPGSGFHGHAGRPGQVGGSSSSNVFSGKMINPNGIDTQSQYMYENGNWTPERKALHQKIIDKFFYGRTPVENPTSYILGGGPASGKTTLLRSGLVDVPENSVLAAGDDIKALLPEYESKGAVFVHEESSYLSKLIAKKAASESYNVVMDGTGDSSLKSLASKVASMSSLGQSVEGIYVTVDVNTAIARSLERARMTGRYMPESVLRENHRLVSHIFPSLAESGMLARIRLFDTSYPSPKLVVSAIGANLTVHDVEDYRRFLYKANE